MLHFYRFVILNLKLLLKRMVKHNVQVLDETGNECNFKVHYSVVGPGICSSKIEIFCPFWIINKSGLPLVYSKPQRPKGSRDSDCTRTIVPSC